ncbi:TlyA family RNA methyltransferase [Thermanaerothrix sp. 4228-RoL]|uniref:TlyA family RNA methyltransferase n=1 Tax=Thermanaerothrix solaris TaxID=3058434 RepID=A0ABU3NMS6_9CHLR|nr:TlyA family RNA methyltransferase [Thermanaerothrix sp. 4228-RoL]MDT8897468.1 TlyA family RNA methyltransferase [Thermanaerothrix sp. 4228-RoL]
MKERLDVLMVERGLAESRAKAQRLIMAGQVRVGGETVLKPGTLVLESAQIEIVEGMRYVSRGGEKLEAALDAFELTHLEGWVCADVGASTGGFTDCLLAHGAARVYAIDVGYGQLHWKLRQDPRVVVLERTNVRYLTDLPEQVDLVTIDVSFISLKLVLPTVKGWLKPEGKIIALIKPQFEAGPSESARGKGVIRDPRVHHRVLEEVLAFAVAIGLTPQGLIRSPLLGPKGNVEFLTLLTPGSGESKTSHLLSMINAVVSLSH